jgi:hypothetical protein
MSDDLVDIRAPLAVSRHVRVEIGRDGVLHVLVGAVTLHLERAVCEELTTTLARAMVTLIRVQPKGGSPTLTLVRERLDDGTT